MKYLVNNFELHYEADGERITGDDIVLINKDIDLVRQCSWSKEGFTIEPLFDNHTFQEFKSNARKLLLHLWASTGASVPDDFLLSNYHLLFTDKQSHLAAVNKTKLLSISDFPVDIKLLEERISNICSENLEVKNPFNNESVFHFRVIRPDTSDNNPLHRDIWLEDYQDCINLYIPIAGSNELSSLILIPQSHHWPESCIERTKSGAIINDVKFNVPAVTSILCNYEVVRPNPQENEVLVFSPYLIHGGAVNLNHEATRISIEIRLWRKS